MAGRDFVADADIQTAVAQDVTQQTDGTEPVPSSTSPALSTASDLPGPDQVQTRDSTDCKPDTSRCVSPSARRLNSRKGGSIVGDSVHIPTVRPDPPHALSKLSSLYDINYV